ncbi:MAG TPA: SDR family oxidoreductase [Terriglobales bacterium]|nr:SDR family oxidoreductase [Terriglobales bacterium]
MAVPGALDEVLNSSIKHKTQPAPVYWRVEGSLLNLSTVRPVAFFAWNAQTFSERWLRRGAIFLQALLRPILYAIDRTFATRLVHTILRGISRDRLDLLGEEYFWYVLKAHLKPEGVQKLRQLVTTGQEVVLVSQGLDHVMRPLAEYLEVTRLLCNRLEFRDNYCTGRLLDPVIRPRGILALITGGAANGSRTLDELSTELDFRGKIDTLSSAVVSTERKLAHRTHPVIHFDSVKEPRRFSVRSALAGKNVLLIGVTGFIGKVWLAQLLESLPEVGKIYLLIRRQKSNSARRRFEKILEESPIFDPLHQRYRSEFERFISRRVEVLEGDAGQPGFGLPAGVLQPLQATLDLVVNSSGLTDFNPDLREALASNVDSVLHLIQFVRQCDHAGLLHLSTCYVAGARDGRVEEELHPNYTPLGISGFDAESERQALHKTIQDAIARSESPEIDRELRRQAQQKTGGKELSAVALENQIRKNRVRWLRAYLTEAGTKRAKELGWPNTYTLTKSLAESLIQKLGAGLPIAVVRPSIVETSVTQPFRGWNEGINTSASLSYLLGTYFRQLPSNERKRLDIIPVDTVCRGMTLIAAAIVQRCHEPVYQLATSVSNPCDMARSIELTCLAHRKFYRAQDDPELRRRLRFDTIAVSKQRYNRLSAPAQKALVKSLQKITAPFPFLQPPLVRTERGLERVEKLIELFEPFILHNEHDFEAEHIEWLSQALPAEERSVFGYDTRSLDWYEYWINIHIPALRKWTYPLIEGRPIESGPRPRFQMSSSPPPEGGVAADNDQTLQTGTGTTWQYS